MRHALASLALIAIVFIWPPPSCPVDYMVLEFRCLTGNPNLICTSNYAIYPPDTGYSYDAFEYVGAGVWWFVTPFDAAGQPVVDPSCQPSGVTADGRSWEGL